MTHECADCGSENVEEVEFITEFPKEALLFETTNPTVSACS
jgi:hypothetical protein